MLKRKSLVERLHLCKSAEHSSRKSESQPVSLNICRLWDSYAQYLLPRYTGHQPLLKQEHHLATHCALFFERRLPLDFLADRKLWKRGNEWHFLLATTQCCLSTKTRQRRKVSLELWAQLPLPLIPMDSVTGHGVVEHNQVWMVSPSSATRTLWAPGLNANVSYLEQTRARAVSLSS